MRPRVSIAFAVSYFLSSISAIPVSTVAARTRSLECVPASPLAPIDDCRAVLNALQKAASNWPKDVKWGQTVVPTSFPDLRKIQLPFGLRLQKIGPRSQSPSNKCEIRIDNAIGELWAIEVFDLTEVIDAGTAVTELCMPDGLTGMAYPGEQRNVHVTTAYVPDPDYIPRLRITTAQTAQNLTIVYLDEAGRLINPSNSSITALT